MKKIMILYGFLLFSFVSAQNNSERIDNLNDTVNKHQKEISNLTEQYKSSIDILNKTSSVFNLYLIVSTFFLSSRVVLG